MKLGVAAGLAVGWAGPAGASTGRTGRTRMYRASTARNSPLSTMVEVRGRPLMRHLRSTPDGTVNGLCRRAFPRAYPGRDDFARLGVRAVLYLPQHPADDELGDVVDREDDTGKRQTEESGADAAVEADNREITADAEVPWTCLLWWLTTPTPPGVARDCPAIWVNRCGGSRPASSQGR